MKRFTKMLALGMAAALAFGMTVSAAPSNPSKDTNDNVEDVVNVIIQDAGVQDSQGNVLENPPKVEAITLPESYYENPEFGSNYDDACSKAINSAAVSPKIDAVFAEAFPGVSADKMELYSDIIDIQVEGEIPAGGLYVPVWVSGDGEAYVVAHWNGQAWEVLQTKVENGVVYALFPSGFSPVSLTIVTVGEDAGEEEPDDDNNNNNNNNNNNSNNSNNSSSTPASPKTGETAPVAGILAVICLAGVAVCAKKARYNR